MDIKNPKKERTLKILVRQKLIKEESNLTKFWKARLKDECKISYFHFCNMLNERTPFREDVEKILLEFVNGR